MKLSSIRKLKAFCDNLISQPYYREVISQVNADLDDFEVDNVRFIKSSQIDGIQVQELEADGYILGCFNASFLAGITDLDVSLIEIIQKNEGYQELGEWLIRGGYTKDIQLEYSRLDGYGHHFNSYDFSEETIIIDGVEYYVFDNQ